DRVRNPALARRRLPAHTGGVELRFARLLERVHRLRRRPRPPRRHVVHPRVLGDRPRQPRLLFLRLLLRCRLRLLRRLLRCRLRVVALVVRMGGGHSRDEHKHEGRPQHGANHTLYAPPMDLEIFEALALSEDRTAALAQLLPGSEDHDYYRCLHAQHANRLDEADEILAAWPERHGSTARYDRLRLRQQLCRLGTEPGRVADEIRDRFGVQHWHQAEAPEVDPDRATRLTPGTFDAEALLQQAIDYDAHLSQLTDEGLYEVLGRPLDP